MLFRGLLLVGLLSVACRARHARHARHASHAILAHDAMNLSFAAYKEAYRRLYASGGYEHQMREQLFNTRAAEIIAHNSAGHSWLKHHNQFSDRTEEEMAAMRGYKRTYSEAASGGSFLDLGGNGHKSCTAAEGSCMNSHQSCCSNLICGSAGVCVQPAAVTESKDWTTLATSDDILDQGGCGSCWAVAAAAVIQLHAAANYEDFDTVLSPQSILACTPNKMECGGQGGCQGATPELAFQWVKDQGVDGAVLPLDEEDYTANDNTGTCVASGESFLQRRLRHHTASQPKVGIGGWTRLMTNSASQVMNALVTVGPLAVAIAGMPIQFYFGGVLNCFENLKQTTVIDHAVVMMGYGDDPEHGMYWSIRNSWGANWGENGYLRVRRHTPTGDEPCGWDKKPEVGTACKDPETGKYPEQTWVCGECGVLSDVVYPVDVKVPQALLS